MNTKRKIKKPAAARKPVTNADQRRELANLIAAVLTHPAVPVGIYEGLMDGILEINSSVKIYENADVIRGILDLHMGGAD